MTSQPVYQMSHKWEFIEEFPSIAAAMRKTGWPRLSIRQSLDKNGNFDGTEKFLWLDRSTYERLYEVNEMNAMDKSLPSLSYVITLAMLYQAISILNLYIRKSNEGQLHPSINREHLKNYTEYTQFKSLIESYMTRHSIQRCTTLPGWRVDKIVVLVKEMILEKWPGMYDKYRPDECNPVTYLLKRFSKYGTYQPVTESGELDIASTLKCQEIFIVALDNIKDNQYISIYDFELFKKRFTREGIVKNILPKLEAPSQEFDPEPQATIQVDACQQFVGSSSPESPGMPLCLLQHLYHSTPTMMQSASQPVSSSANHSVEVPTAPPLNTKSDTNPLQHVSVPQLSLDIPVTSSLGINLDINSPLSPLSPPSPPDYDITDHWNLFLKAFRAVESKIRHYDYELNPITQISFEELEASILQLRMTARNIRQKNGDLSRYLVDIRKFADRVHFIGRELEHRKDLTDEKSPDRLPPSLELPTVVLTKPVTPSRVLRPRKQNISQDLREQIWNVHIGDQYNKILCPYCGERTISPFGFHCGHVKAEVRGGEVTVENLRPICGTCNSRMRTNDMDLVRYKIRTINKTMVSSKDIRTDGSGFQGVCQ
jgi:5-methylcytosine-specific restriction endonuclease McrA